MRVRAIVIAALFGATACKEIKPTQALVHVRTDLPLDAFVEYLVEIDSVEWKRIPPPAGGALEQTFGIVVGDGMLARSVEVKISALDREGRVKGYAYSVVSGFRAHEQIEVYIFVSAQTGPRDGGLEDARASDAGEPDATDTEPDTGADPPDSGVSDHGFVDGGPSTDSGIVTEQLIHLGGTGNVHVNALISDGAGGWIAGGYFTGHLRIDSTDAMADATSPDGFVAAFNANGSLRSLVKLESESPNSVELITGLALGAPGFIYVTATIDSCAGALFSGQMILPAAAPCAADSSMLVFEYDTIDDDLLPGVQLFAGGVVQSAAIAYDGLNGLLLVSGSFTGMLFGFTCAPIASAGATDAFVAALDSNTLGCNWLARAGGPSDDFAGPNALVVLDPDVFLGGMSGAEGSLETETSTAVLPHASQDPTTSDAFIAKMRKIDGAPVAVLALGGAGARSGVRALTSEPGLAGLVAAGEFTRGAASFFSQRGPMRTPIMNVGADQPLLGIRIVPSNLMVGRRETWDASNGAELAIASAIAVPGSAVFAGFMKANNSAPPDAFFVRIATSMPFTNPAYTIIGGPGQDSATAIVRAGSTTAVAIDFDQRLDQTPWGTSFENSGGFDGLIYVFSTP